MWNEWKVEGNHPNIYQVSLSRSLSHKHKHTRLAVKCFCFSFTRLWSSFIPSAQAALGSITKWIILGTASSDGSWHILTSVATCSYTDNHLSDWEDNQVRSLNLRFQRSHIHSHSAFFLGKMVLVLTRGHPHGCNPNL